MKIAYVIVERNGRTYWNRIGVGFVNQDGSINVRLDALPVSGEFQLRDQSPTDRRDRDESVARSFNLPVTSPFSSEDDDDIPF